MIDPRKRCIAIVKGLLHPFKHSRQAQPARRKSRRSRRELQRLSWGRYPGQELLGLLGLESLEPRHLLTSISAVTPAANSFDSSLDAGVSVSLDGRTAPANLAAAAFAVYGGHSGTPEVTDNGQIDTSSLHTDVDQALEELFSAERGG